MSYLKELLNSALIGLLLALIVMAVGIARQRRAFAKQVKGYVDANDDRMAKYRAAGRVSCDRALDPQERRLLEFFLCRATVVPSPFCEDVGSARVSACCACGCPSIDVTVSSEEAAGRLYPISEYWWRGSDGLRYGIFPVARGGHLFGLQVYPLDGSAPPMKLPSVEELQAFAAA